MDIVCPGLNYFLIVYSKKKMRFNIIALFCFFFFFAGRYLNLFVVAPYSDIIIRFAVLNNCKNYIKNYQWKYRKIVKK